MNVQVKAFERKLDERVSGSGSQDFDFSWCTRVRGYFDGKGSGGIIFQEGRVDEVIFVGDAVPKKIGGFLVMGTFYGLGLQGGGVFAIKSMFDGCRG